MSCDDEMQVVKRNGNYENVSFDKILNRVKKLGNETNPKLSINYSQLVIKVIDQLYPNISTAKIDELTAEQCASLCTKHLDYGNLASRVIISNNHKNTPKTFYEAMEKLYFFTDIHNLQSSLISKELWNVTEKYKDRLNNLIIQENDYLIDYFGFKTLERAYLMRMDNITIETPQYMWLRVAIGINGDNIDLLEETYKLMSQKYFTHATPTLYNAGTPRQQLSSCYLIGMEDDSITGIYNTLNECANISKWAGGIGLHIHNVRATGSHIRGTNGTSNGIVPMLRVFNMTARYVDQGGGKRNGSFAIYIEPWHGDIYEFLDLRKNHGDEEMRARDLFYALWIPDLFMEKIKDDLDWNLFCPDQCPGLSDAYGSNFKELYDKYTCENKMIKTVKARELWFKILDSQMETGTPYILYKDAANLKSNQKNLGTIKSSNLCCEIIEYSDHEQTAVCNLASIGLSNYVNEDKTFNYDKLYQVTGVITSNLNKIIDVNFYPTEKTRLSNFLHRPIGIGVQGLADVFALMDIPYHSDRALEVNKLIFETIYYASLERSNKIAMKRSEDMKKINDYYVGLDDSTNCFEDLSRTCRQYNNLTQEQQMLFDKCRPIRDEIINNETTCGAYSSFRGSPLSEGIFQFDMWDKIPTDRYNWETLKQNIIKYGVRNSLLVAPMPTASTAQILGNNECFEPFTSNIYSRRTLAGDYVIANKYMMRELIDLGIWNEDIKDNIIINKGSIQHIDIIPQHIKDKYKIVWEIPMKHMIDMAADRGAFICQSQSLNLWLEDPTYKSLTSMHFYSWNKGLKTGIYYLRRKPKHQAQQFTIDPNKLNSNNREKQNDSYVEEMNENTCEACSG
tara:strand:+ start:1644 stop:4190 length:2547 start_codon:yes stop_codon:yes gene_type:complete